MNELLDNAIPSASQKYPIPPAVKWVGLALILLWALLLFTEITTLYFFVGYTFLLDAFLIGLIGILMYPTYESHTLQTKKLNYHLWVPFLIISLVIGTVMVNFIDHNLYNNSFLSYLLNYTARIGLIYLLTQFVITAYQDQLHSMPIWPWLERSARIVLGAIFFNTIVNGTDWYYLWGGWVFLVVLVVVLVYSIQCYQQTAIIKGPLQKTSWFMASICIAILGKAIPSLNKEIISLLGVGMALLVAFYAWIDSEDEVAT
ncbi:MAG: hypothetical protein AB8E82_13220 [Aureispira sp.]